MNSQQPERPPETTGSATRGFLLCIYSVDTETQAAALVSSMAGRSRAGCVVVAQDYCLTLPWRRRVGEVFVRRSVQSGGGHLRWLNKLEALSDTAFEETIFLDCDMLVMKDIDHWWEGLATDDLTFWNFRRRPEDIGPEAMVMNQLNPHPFCGHYGVEGADLKDHGRYRCEWAQTEVEPEVIHFAGGGGRTTANGRSLFYSG